MTRARRGARAAALVAVAGMALAGCGGDQDGESTSSSSFVSPRTPSSTAGSSTTGSSSAQTSTTAGGPSTSTGSSSTASGSPSGAAGGSPSTSGSGTTADLPPEARQNTKAGAIAFTKFWFEEGGRALVTGETASLVSITGPDCAACQDFIQTIDDGVEKGIHTNKNPVVVSNMTAHKRPDSGYRVELLLRTTPHSFTDASGKVVEKYDGASSHVTTHTEWAGGRWIMNRWVISLED